MPALDADLNAAVNARVTAGTWYRCHTGNPGTTGANEVTGGTYAAQQATFAAAVSGSRTAAQLSFSIPGGSAVTYISRWTAGPTGGTCLATDPVTGGEASANTWTFQLTPTLTVTA